MKIGAVETRPGETPEAKIQRLEQENAELKQKQEVIQIALDDILMNSTGGAV